MACLFLAGLVDLSRLKRRSATSASSRTPVTTPVRALVYSGLLCIAFYTLVPVAFQGYLGLEGLLDPGIYDGTGVRQDYDAMVGAGPVVGNIIICILTLSICLVVMTAMAGSSRTLYQGSLDGWLPKYLSRVNSHGAPVAAMWTDLAVNAVLPVDFGLRVPDRAREYHVHDLRIPQSAGWMAASDRPAGRRSALSCSELAAGRGRRVLGS